MPSGTPRAPRGFRSQEQYDECIEQIREAMDLRGYNQLEVSMLSGVSCSALSRAMSGKSCLSRASMTLVTHALDCWWDGDTLRVKARQRRDYLLDDIAQLEGTA